MQPFPSEADLLPEPPQRRSPDPDIQRLSHDPDYFRLGRPVGREAANDRADVIKAQTLLANAGYYDLAGTDGPTGWYGQPLERALRRYQKDNDLTVDGVMRPGGETVSALQSALESRLGSHAAPSPADVDRHHDRLARGQSGLLTGAATDAAPAGVTTGGMDAARPRGGRNGEQQEANAAFLNLLGMGAAAVTGAVMHKSLQEQQRRRQANPDDATGAAAAPWRQGDDRYQAFRAMNRAVLGEGVRHGFGDRLESSMGNENTRTSNNILIRACEAVIDKEVKPQGFDVKHIAGGSEKERGIREGEDGKGGRGSSFPDVLFRDEKGNFIPFNTVTENAQGQMIPREDKSWERLLYNIGHEVAGHLGKKGGDQSDEDYYKEAYRKCREVFARYREERRTRDKLDQRWGDRAPPEASPEASPDAPPDAPPPGGEP